MKSSQRRRFRSVCCHTPLAWENLVTENRSRGCVSLRVLPYLTISTISRHALGNILRAVST